MDRKDVEPEGERKTWTTESNNGAGHHPRKVIPYKEYAAHKAAEVKPSTTSKLAVQDEEDWDEELLLLLVKLHQGLNLCCSLRKMSGS